MRHHRVVFVFLAIVLASAQAAAQSVDQSIADLKSPDLALRTGAAQRLWIMSEENPLALIPALPALTQAVLDTDLNIRYMAMSSLKTLGPAAVSAVPSLIKALDTFPGGNPPLQGPPRYYADARWAAADALGAIGPGAKSAIPALQKALKDSSRNVREAAANALKNIEGK